MEPDDRFYQPLLQPLINAEGSTYKLIPKSGVVWAHLERVLSKEHLPLQKELENGDPRLEHGNDTLLVTANLGYFPRKPYRGFTSLPVLLVYQFLSALRAHSLFHKYGHVRMLIWVADNEKHIVLPKTVAMRRKSAIEAEISCDNIFEVASSTVEANRVRRDHFLDRQSAIDVLARMEKLGIKTPEGRESVFSSAITTTGKVPDAGEVVELSRDFYKELECLETAFSSGQFAEYLDGDRSAANQTRQYKRLKELRYRRDAENRKGARGRGLTSEYDAIMTLQKEIFSQSTGDSLVQREELNQRVQNWKDDVQILASNDQEEFLHQLDNHRAYYLNPPLLLWDRRECDPLKVNKDEFHPKQEMCLLDFRPKPMWPILRENFPANYDVFEYIVSSLLLMPTQSLRKGLTALWPGAFEWLIAECPSLTDPNRGGNLDIDLITARSLTQDMYKEIIEAWLRWPFRPTRFELMARTGSGAYDPDDDSGEIK
jgi:transcription factor 1